MRLSQFSSEKAKRLESANKMANKARRVYLARESNYTEAPDDFYYRTHETAIVTALVTTSAEEHKNL